MTESMRPLRADQAEPTSFVPFRHILVPTDFSEPAAIALDTAVSLQSKYDARLTLLHVYEFPFYAYSGFDPTLDLVTPARVAAESLLREALAGLKKRVPTAGSIFALGTAWQEIMRVIEEQDVDLVVMGTHGRRGVDRALLGSVANKTVQLSPVPVLVVPAPHEPTRAEPKKRA